LKTILKNFIKNCLDDEIGGTEGKIGGIPVSATALIAAALRNRFFHSDSSVRGGGQEGSKGEHSSILVIAPTNSDAESLASEARLFCESDRIAFFPGYEALPYEYSGMGTDIVHQRIRVLYRLLARERMLIFTSPEALLRRIPSSEIMRGLSVRLKSGGEIEPERLLRQLFEMGYERKDRVDVPGDLCVKGSLVDLFPLNEVLPIRVDFFDTIIDSIRLFDPDTQRTREKIEECVILPAGEIILKKGEVELLSKKLRDFPSHLERPVWWDHTEESLKGGTSVVLTQLQHPGLNDLFSIVQKTESLFDFFDDEPFTVLVSSDKIEERVGVITREYETLYEKERENRICLPPERLILPELPSLKKRTNRLILDEWHGDTTFEDHPEKRCRIRRSEGFAGRLREVRGRIGEIYSSGATVCITSPYSAQLNRIAGIFRGEGIAVHIIDVEELMAPPELTGSQGIHLIRSPLREGFVIPDLNLYFWTDADIFGRSYRRRTRFKTAGSSAIESFLDLRENDFVVHVNHGIGRFRGLERVEAAGRERDFLVLEYAEKDKLYVPLDQISLVQKYVAATENPQLDSLGRASFKRVRERVEKKIEEFAEELIKIYAVRMSQKGYAFPPDTAWQEEFEADFQYEETPDQISSIDAVKEDMESPRPMDRLVCGDVGYGKTEVAIRAAFKAVMAGRQVAVVCPTTILALQHFTNFSERFKNYPIRVDWISRFRSRAEISAIKRDLLAGEIDVVIGTHSLLTKDIHIKNIGLLVIDEEQRFGVIHKEAIKKMKKLVDVLTLTATPIPRTLHMSLVGIRDLSIILTPPKDRLPVLTYVIEDSDALLVEALTREIDRGGQVFYLHNRVESIEIAANRIRTLLPQLSVVVLHGQMEEHEIEDVLLDFLERRYDVLVTTTIIESGIDMPNVNTLIVDRADTFGLSQLYQIRGRVGRSNRQAYAYLFYPDRKALTETAQKRLNTIMEYQELGSGFKVAMRDLEIRGAGNVLGREQSGDIVEVGYELYVKLLEDAVRRLKGEQIEVDVRCSINLRTDFYLPEEYITDVRQRIEMYKRLEGARSDDDVKKIAGEMADRFGPLPDKAVTFIQIESIRALASMAGFENVFEEDSGRIQFKAGEHFRVTPERLISVLKTMKGLSVMPGKKDTLFFEPSGKSLSERLDSVIGMIGSMVVEIKEKRSGGGENPPG
jgi:transcription-repair coupling factor (superfamily II helicase)